MTKVKYSIDKKSIMGGIVTMNGYLSTTRNPMFAGNFHGELIDKSRTETLNVEREIICRTILFGISTINALGIDLLYLSDDYKIENIPTTAKNYSEDYPIIKNGIVLYSLLDLLGYGEKLNNIELFDFIANLTSNDDFIEKIAVFYGYEKNENRIFIPIKEGILPSDDFRIIREMRYTERYKPSKYEPNYLLAKRKR